MDIINSVADILKDRLERHIEVTALHTCWFTATRMHHAWSRVRVIDVSWHPAGKVAVTQNNIMNKLLMKQQDEVPCAPVADILVYMYTAAQAILVSYVKKRRPEQWEHTHQVWKYIANKLDNFRGSQSQKEPEKNSNSTKINKSTAHTSKHSNQKHLQWYTNTNEGLAWQAIRIYN